jgi:hypothetical protein
MLPSSMRATLLALLPMIAACDPNYAGEDENTGQQATETDTSAGIEGIPYTACTQTHSPTNNPDGLPLTIKCTTQDVPFETLEYKLRGPDGSDAVVVEGTVPFRDDDEGFHYETTVALSSYSQAAPGGIYAIELIGTYEDSSLEPYQETTDVTVRDTLDPVAESFTATMDDSSPGEFVTFAFVVSGVYDETAMGHVELTESCKATEAYMTQDDLDPSLYTKEYKLSKYDCSGKTAFYATVVDAALNRTTLVPITVEIDE